MYKLVLRKGVRGTVFRELVTSEGTVRFEAAQRDIIFDHSGEHPILRDLNASRQIIAEYPVPIGDVTEIETATPLLCSGDGPPQDIKGPTENKETTEQMVARIKAEAAARK